jgi:hypothetical protein
MKRMFALGLIGASLAAAALPALAQSAPDRGPGRIQARIFQQADGNGDGRVSEGEAMAFLAARFAEADADQDGALTPDELGTYLRAQWDAARPGPAAGRERRDPPPRLRTAMAEHQSRIFRMADANRDGRVTLDEARSLATIYFRAADRNGDGALELAELRGPERSREGARRKPAPAIEAPAAPAR